MKVLYFDTWRKTPEPLPFPDCVTVRVLSACTPGNQAHISTQVSKTVLFKEILRRSRRALKRALHYSKAIGTMRLAAKVRSNILEYQSHLFGTVASVSGIAAEADGDCMISRGTRVAGFRKGYPLYADLLLLHHEQTVEVPDAVSHEDAATVFYYALALKAFNRIHNDCDIDIPVVVCGDNLCCRILRQLLTDSHREVKYFAEWNNNLLFSARTLIRKGGITVIGNQMCHQFLTGQLADGQIYYLGLNADNLQPKEWQELESNWIGLPHSSCRNLNIFSRIPIETPEYINRKGLQDALLDMSGREWSPSSFLMPYAVKDAKEGTRLSLEQAYSFTGNNTAQKKESIISRKAHVEISKQFLRVGVAGLGLWARGNLIPFLLKDSRVRLVMGADRDPIRLHQAADLFDIPLICCDPAELCNSEKVDAVFISTWHDSHAVIASKALCAGKKVFVEKPPVIDYNQLKTLSDSIRDNPNSFLAVGYNRPHSELTKIIHPEILKEKGPVTFTAIVREPSIPRTHYYYWPHQGTRIVGNSCHWIDYAFHLLLPRVPEDIQVISAFSEDAQDNNVIIMRYRDGSIVSLTFTNRGEALINGDEYIDIKMADTEYMIHDFKTCTRYKEGKLECMWKSKADRGWKQELHDVVDGMLSAKPPRDYADILTSAILVLEAKYSYENNGAIRRISPELMKKLSGLRYE